MIIWIMLFILFSPLIISLIPAILNGITLMVNAFIPLFDGFGNVVSLFNYTFASIFPPALIGLILGLFVLLFIRFLVKGGR